MSLSNVSKAARTLANARERVDLMEGLLRSAILRALHDGQRVADIAEAAGISRARVYQIRDGRR